MAKISPTQMVLVWNYDSARRISGSRIREKGPDTEETRSYPASLGACCAGWMDGSTINTPIGLFAQLSTLYGFASDEAKREMLREFTKVDGQGWAKDLLWELDGRPDT